MGAGLPTRLRGWSIRRWIIIGVSAVILLVIIIAVAVGVTNAVRRNAYPDYSKLNYTLADTYSGTDFFNNFNYFSGEGGSSLLLIPEGKRRVR